MRQRANIPGVEQEFTPFAGGFDTVTPPLEIPPGFVRQAQNYEMDINGGYGTVVGYERFDGRAKPSDAIYAVLQCTITGTVAPGDILTDNTAAAFGTVIALPAGQAVLTKLTGTFATGNIKIGATVVGTCIGPQIIDGAATPQLHAQYNNLAADVYRAVIQAVPGAGDILGVFVFNDVTYAVRNAAGGLTAAMYKSTSGGWSLVNLGHELAFTSGGMYQVLVGDTITGATSGATAVVTGIGLSSNAASWAAGTATGTFTFASQTGTFQAENLNVGANLNVATIAGNSAAITFAIPGGRVKAVLENFGGGAGTKKVYGCDGKNRGWEFDGTAFIPINTGMFPDTPHNVYAHKSQLFFAFGGSAQHSGPGTPFAWTLLSGSAELAVGDTITNFQQEPGNQIGGTLGIYSRNRITMLYGSSPADWQLDTYKGDAGAIANSVQRVLNTVMFDDRGITSLTTTQRFGNFAAASLSRRIQTWLRDKKTKTNDSCIVRDKDQYRLFFSDRYALYATFDNGKLIGMMPILFAHVVKCCWSCELNDGSEAIFFGSDDGFVYQMERGTSFDGENIEAFLYFAWDNQKSPRVLKSYRKSTFEITGLGYAEFIFGYDLGYGNAAVAQPGEASNQTNFGSVNWDAPGVVWDGAGFYWDGQTLTPSECDMPGDAENCSLRIRSSSDYFAPIRFSGVLTNFIPRRRLR